MTRKGSERNQSEQVIYYMITAYMTFQEKPNSGNSKEIGRTCGRENVAHIKHRGVLIDNILNETVMVDTGHLSKVTEFEKKIELQYKQIKTKTLEGGQEIRGWN